MVRTEAAPLTCRLPAGAPDAGPTRLERFRHAEEPRPVGRGSFAVTTGVGRGD